MEELGFDLRSAGEILLRGAIANGALVLERCLSAIDFEVFRPHQSRKRRAVWARLAGQRAAGSGQTYTLGMRAGY
jgi:coenzyme F420 hydrogenase subunit beta